ncbi:MAG: hypothetical protein CHACPFDD_03848 [Phycisphaerae bacterium]|nr:hypothetical protein [Phycisphaerae bacterium]
MWFGSRAWQRGGCGDGEAATPVRLCSASVRPSCVPCPRNPRTRSGVRRAAARGMESSRPRCTPRGVRLSSMDVVRGRTPPLRSGLGWERDCARRTSFAVEPLPYGRGSAGSAIALDGRRSRSNPSLTVGARLGTRGSAGSAGRGWERDCARRMSFAVEPLPYGRGSAGSAGRAWGRGARLGARGSAGSAGRGWERGARLGTPGTAGSAARLRVPGHFVRVAKLVPTE